MEEEIKRIRNNEVVRQHIHIRLLDWLSHVGIERDDVEELTNSIESLFLQDISIYRVEEKIRRLISNFNVEGIIQQRLSEEEDMVFGQVRPNLVEGSVLDVGTGSGMIAEKMDNAGFPTKVTDILDFNRSNLPLTLYDGKKLPFSDDEFTNITLLTVLHHCEFYRKVLEEAIRVCADNIIIIESVYIDSGELFSNMFFDWLWNRVIYTDVNVPFNFREPVGWEELFNMYGLAVRSSIDLGYDSPMTPEHHWLFVLGKL